MVFEKVQAIIAKELNVSLDKITMDTHLVDDLGADSLDAVAVSYTHLTLPTKA